MDELKKLRSEVAVIQLGDIKQLEVVSGTKKLYIIADKPFSDISLYFLDELSNVL